MDMRIKTEPGILNDTNESVDFYEEKPKLYLLNAPSEPIVGNSGTVQLREPDNTSNEFNFHSRKVLLRAFQKEGCSLETIKKHSASYSCNVDMATEYYQKAAKDAQDHVHEECDSLSFNNMTEWLKYFKEIGHESECNYEIAIVLNAIANSEFHPDPKLMGDVNLKMIYKFLSNALMGLPQDPLDKESAKFLSNEFQHLIDDVNTEEADNDVRNMKLKIEESLVSTIEGESFDLDPLETSTEGLKEFGSIIKRERNMGKLKVAKTEIL